jgi:hypoxanthine phosphoribosyltransferase
MLPITHYVKRVLGSNDSVLVTLLYYKLLYLYYPKELVPLDYEIADIRHWLNSLSSNFDIVVGIPRSGLMTASIISVEFGKPLSTPDLIVEGRYWITRTNTENLHIPLDKSRILLVDDSGGTGKTMQDAEGLIRKKYPHMIIKTAATYVSNPSDPDYYYTRFTRRQPVIVRALMHNSFIPPVAYDMDGVICEEYNGRDFMDFLVTAYPHKIPIYPIDFIVTGRKEQYRGVTTDWLNGHNVKYGKLLMCPEDEDTVSFKSRMVRKYKPGIFVESSPAEANAINKRTGVMVICIGDERLYGS